jgi:type VI secretion system FHA domain protein
MGAAEPPGELLPFLEAAGVPERDWSPEAARELGTILKVAIEGIMEMLRARADIKSEFRLPLTRVQVKENNPLKLCPNVESVLHTMLVLRNPAYLPSAQAFEDAFSDVSNHQEALRRSLRAAFDSMLQTFEPAQLQKDFDTSARRGRLLRAKTSRYWDLYVERFAELGRDPDDTFRRLFGEVFAEAYESQLEELKRGGEGSEEDDENL